MEAVFKAGNLFAVDAEEKPQSCASVHTLLAVWAPSMLPGVDTEANSAYDTTAFTA